MEPTIHHELAQARRDLLRIPQVRDHEAEFNGVLPWLNAQLPFAIVRQIETYLHCDW